MVLVGVVLELLDGAANVPVGGSLGVGEAIVVLEGLDGAANVGVGGLLGRVDYPRRIANAVQFGRSDETVTWVGCVC
jgi:hypothetical protein